MAARSPQRCVSTTRPISGVSAGPATRNRTRAPSERPRRETPTGVDLGLYSITFSNDVESDLRTLEAYSTFRAEADPLGLRHFLEVFNPAFDVGIPAAELGHYIGDCVVRCLGGVLAAEQPLFLKLATTVAGRSKSWPATILPGWWWVSWVAPRAPRATPSNCWRELSRLGRAWRCSDARSTLPRAP